MLTTEACKIRRINIYLSCAECFLLLISCGPWNHSGRWMAFQLGLPFYWWGNLARAGNWPKIPPAFPWWNQTWDRLRATVLTPLCGAAFNSTFFFPLAALGSWNIGPHGRWLQSRVGPSQLPFRGRCEEGRLWETQSRLCMGWPWRQRVLKALQPLPSLSSIASGQVRGSTTLWYLHANVPGQWPPCSAPWIGRKPDEAFECHLLILYPVVPSPASWMKAS